MKCKKCDSERTIVKDSRTRNTYTGKEYNYVRRRRQCLICLTVFTTYESFVKEEKAIDLVAIRSLTKSILTLLDSGSEV